MIISVVPSGGLFTVNSGPIVLPGLFSTTTGWPQRSCNSFPIRRPEMSSGPPGGKGTTSRTGFEGNSWAAAVAANARNARAAAIRLMRPKTIRAGTIMVRLANRGNHVRRPSDAPVSRHADVQGPREIAPLLRGVPRPRGGAPRAPGDDAAAEDRNVRGRGVHRREGPEPARAYALGPERRLARGGRPRARRRGAPEGRVRHPEDQQGARAPRRLRLLLPGPRQQLVGNPARAARDRRFLREGRRRRHERPRHRHGGFARIGTAMQITAGLHY